MAKAIRPTICRPTTAPRFHIVAITQHKPEALARERRYGGIVSPQPAKPNAHRINAFVTATPQRSASSLTLRACVASALEFGMAKAIRPTICRPTTDPRFHIVAVTQHKPEALARERRYGGIVSLQTAKAECTSDQCVREGDPATERVLAYASGLCGVGAGISGWPKRFARRFAAQQPPHDSTSLLSRNTNPKR
jgi:hypothetical protein